MSTGGPQARIQALLSRDEPPADTPDPPTVPRGYIRILADELNGLSDSYQIGDIQNLRKRLHGKLRPAGHLIFGHNTISDQWAYHYGGRLEAQFNIGEEEDAYIRHGLAFSFEPSQTLPDPGILLPKIRRFNDYFRTYPNAFADMAMWHFVDQRRSEDATPGPIGANLVEQRAFVVLGRRVPYAQLDRHMILSDFDRLLSLYEFIESGDTLPPEGSSSSFRFRAGCPEKKTRANSSRAQRELDISLRHNLLQQALYEALCDQHGRENVGAELRNGPGTCIDLVTQLRESYVFYEIKTASTARGCLREALGQLMEYAYWPGTQAASRLVVVGEPPPTTDSQAYIEKLRREFELPIEYLQVTIPTSDQA